MAEETYGDSEKYGKFYGLSSSGNPIYIQSGKCNESQCLDEAPTLNDVNKRTSNIRKTPVLSTTSVKKPYQYSFQKSRTDKRVSLNVAPLTKNGTVDYIDRLKYVLGEGQYRLNVGQTIYGFLNSTLTGSCGLIFPYTPQVSFQYNVNYESVDITHSNLSYNFYKNSPPPSITIDAIFTADTRANALHMLSALWFLRAVTKCDFGERAYVDKHKNAIPGMPPPILYLNGYNQIMDNIPVIVTGFSYNLPKDKDYVALGVNLDSNVQAFNDRKLYSDVSNDNFFDNFDGSITGASGMKYLNGIANSLKALQENPTTMESNRYNSYYFNNWLPTELSFNIQLKIQPNLLKHKKKFNLNWYKMGLFNLDDYKGGSTAYLTDNKTITDISGTDIDCQTITEISGYGDEVNGKTWMNKKSAEEAIKKAYDKYLYQSMKTSVVGVSRDKDGNPQFTINQVKDYEKTLTDKEKSMFAIKDIVNTKTIKNTEISDELTKNMKPKEYKFDRSGWTW